MSVMGTDDAELANILVPLSFTIQAIIARVGAEHDVSITQARLLGILRDREPTMAGLARFLALDKSSVTGLVDRAERRGLVRRAAAPGDGRSVRVVLTAAGREVIDACGAEVERQIGVLLDGFSEAERGRLAALAGRIVLKDAELKGLDLLAAIWPGGPQ
jgi:MarR family transcriptional regulator, lower aerobic nicotinate degradation pathway regulator